MCGINGVWQYRGPGEVDEQALAAVCNALRCRGPDDTGSWRAADNRVAFSHRRLSIIDLSDAGRQPMSTADGRLTITFNGEIYNYRELRETLSAEGYKFRSHSDTEVLLALYLRDGVLMVKKLRGMFAFAIWDDREKRLLLARDHFGIKPLYYADDGKSLRFSSQVKALLEDPAVSREEDPVGVCGFYVLGSVPEPHTLYRSIRQLEAGCILICEGGSTRLERYFSLGELLSRQNLPAFALPSAEAAAGELSAKPRQALLRRQLTDTVAHHLVADVPVGLFLSAGIDSTVLLSFAREAHRGPLRTVTLGFEEYRGTKDDESEIAARTAAVFGTDHRTIRYTKADFHSARDALFAAMDQPTIDGINTFFISRAAKEAGLKVAFSGLGGDELFGGYPSFRQIPRALGARGLLPLPPALGKAFRVLTAPLLRKVTSPKYAGILEYGDSYEGVYLLRRGLFMPWELPEHLDSDLVKEGWEGLRPHVFFAAPEDSSLTPWQRVILLEATRYMRNQLLRDADWAGMASSLEIRVPFVDVPLYEALAVGEPPFTKAELVELLSPEVQALVGARPKTGFTVPLRHWLGEEQPQHQALRGLRSWALQVHARFQSR